MSRPTLDVGSAADAGSSASGANLGLSLASLPPIGTSSDQDLVESWLAIKDTETYALPNESSSPPSLSIYINQCAGLNK